MGIRRQPKEMRGAAGPLAPKAANCTQGGSANAHGNFFDPCPTGDF